MLITERETRLRESARKSEALLLKGTPWIQTGIVGNEALRSLYSLNKADPQLKEILFQLLRKAVVEEGFKFDDLY